MTKPEKAKGAKKAKRTAREYIRWLTIRQEKCEVYLFIRQKNCRFA